ncbi:MAG: hypothetical protein MJZ27_10490 [Bacteroidales bacterium]|nr:hypothetical protein [Bacteroidales bacterium]
MTDGKQVNNELSQSSCSKNVQKKDRREWTIMNLFAQVYRNFPSRGEISKSERPDFIVTTPKGRIGVELTELKYERLDSEFNMRAHEDFLNQMMHTAYDKYKSFDVDIECPLVVDVQFSEKISPLIATNDTKEAEKANLLREGLAEKIAQIVIDNMPMATGKQYVIDRTSKYGDLHLPVLVERILVTNVSGLLKEHLWYASISTKVKPLSIESVSQRIKDKDKKLEGYDKDCIEQWLLIVQNSFLMSAHYDPVAAARALRHKYPSKFNRVLVFERSNAKVTELKILREG